MEKLERCPICYGIIKIPGQKVEPGHGCQCRYGGSAHPEETREKRRQVVYSHMYMLSETQLNHVLWLQRELCESYSDSDPEKKKCLDELMRAYEERSRAVFGEANDERDRMLKTIMPAFLKKVKGGKAI
jgi:hypothetical protein